MRWARLSGCFLVGSHNAQRSGENFEDDTYSVRCQQCGHYKLTREAAISGVPPVCGSALSRYVRESHLSNSNKIVMITTDVIDGICP